MPVPAILVERAGALVVVGVVALGCGAASVAPAHTAAIAPPRPTASDADVERPAPSAASVTSGDGRAPADAREAEIKKRFGGACRIASACGGLLGVDCDAAVAGPYYYVRADSFAVVSRCGGYCDGARCTSCPPRAWICPVDRSVE